MKIHHRLSVNLFDTASILAVFDQVINIPGVEKVSDQARRFNIKLWDDITEDQYADVLHQLANNRNLGAIRYFASTPTGEQERLLMLDENGRQMSFS